MKMNKKEKIAKIHSILKGLDREPKMIVLINGVEHKGKPPHPELTKEELHLYKTDFQAFRKLKNIHPDDHIICIESPDL